MTKTKWLCALGMLVLFFASTSVGADEIAELKEQIQMQNLQLKTMEQKIEQLEARQKQESEQLKNQITEVGERTPATGLPESLKWAENIKLSGDLRYRHESIDSESSGRWSEGRNRNRIRLRLNAEAKVNEDTDVGITIASGAADPVSTNQTLENGFTSKEIWLDRAWAHWHPGSMEGFELVMGKMANPFYAVGKNQLIWDGDLSPEGIAAWYSMPVNGSTLNVAAGGFWVDENQGSTATDVSLWGAQGYVKSPLENEDYILGGASIYKYGNVKGKPTIYATTDSFGNTTDGSGNYMSDFELVELFGEYGFKLDDTPAAIYADYVNNNAATSGDDTGWLIGFKYNKAKKVGTWEVSYDYRDLEADAVPGVFTDSDFIGGGTDGKGHRFGFTYQLAKNLQGGLTYFMNERGSAENDYRRLQADFVFKF